MPSPTTTPESDGSDYLSSCVKPRLVDVRKRVRKVESKTWKSTCMKTTNKSKVHVTLTNSDVEA